MHLSMSRGRGRGVVVGQPTGIWLIVWNPTRTLIFYRPIKWNTYFRNFPKEGPKILFPSLFASPSIFFSFVTVTCNLPFMAVQRDSGHWLSYIIVLVQIQLQPRSFRFTSYLFSFRTNKDDCSWSMRNRLIARPPFVSICDYFIFSANRERTYGRFRSQAVPNKTTWTRPPDCE